MTAIHNPVKKYICAVHKTPMEMILRDNRDETVIRCRTCEVLEETKE